MGARWTSPSTSTTLVDDNVREGMDDPTDLETDSLSLTTVRNEDEEWRRIQGEFGYDEEEEEGTGEVG